MKDFKFYLDQWGVQDKIYNNSPGLNQLEKSVMEKALNEVNAAFVQEFGKIGNFRLEYKRQRVKGKGAKYVNGTRPVYQIVAQDSTTRIILRNYALKYGQNWLDKFNKGMKF